MTPFGPGGQGDSIPQLPLDIPVAETPPPDFSKIGKAFAEAQTQAQTELAADGGAFDWLWRQLLKAVAAVVSVFADLFSIALAQVYQVLEGSSDAVNQLTNIVVNGMFGQEVAPVNPGTIRDGENHRTTTLQIAQLFGKVLATGQTSSAGLQPSSAGADAFMATAAHMAFEGWLFGWVAETAEAGQLETFAQLKDILESALGIGRLARRVMAPPVKILVEDPYTWLLNQKYLPTMLTPAELVKYYLRGGIDRNALQAQMALHGYKTALVDQLIADQAKPLAAPEIVDLLGRGILSTDDAIAALRVQGYDATQAPMVLGVITRQRADGLARRGCDEALGLYRARKIDRPTFDFVITNARLPADEQHGFTALADVLDYGNRTRFTIAEAETLVEKGVWDFAQFSDLATFHGYDAGDVADMEALLRIKIKAAEDAAAAKAAAATARAQREADAAARRAAALAKALAEVEAKGVSVGQYETLVEDGLRTLAQYRAFLLLKEVAPDNADALVSALQIKIKAKADAAAAKAAALAKKGIKHTTVAQLEDGVKQGILTIPDFILRLGQLGFSLPDAALIAEELQGTMNTAAAKEKAAAEAKAKAAEKHVDLSQEERAVRLGNQTMTQYAAFLTAHGFTAEDAAILESNLQSQLDTDKQTAAKKAAAGGTVTGKGITLAQLEKLVRAGVEPIANYTAALSAAGYSAADQAALTQYLQLELDQDQQELIVHGHAAALVGQLGVSLADLERAVKLSVVPIQTYQDALQRAGLAPADQQTLVSNLAAEIKSTRAQQTTTATVSKQVAAAGVSLATLERDVMRGALSLTQFEGLLNGYGVPADQVTDVVALLQDMLDNAAAVQALVNQAGARAAAKGLDLAQDTAAYKTGVMTEDEWRARVASLGYDAADVEILFETLAAAQAATAAKSAAKSGATVAASLAPAPAAGA